MLAKLLRTLRFLVVEQIRMVNDLSQLDDDVLVEAYRRALLNGALLQELSVYGFLLLGNAYCHMDLYLGWKVLLDLFLDSAQHKGPEDLVQLVYYLRVLLLLLNICHVLSLLPAQVEPFVELLAGAEYLG